MDKNTRDYGVLAHIVRYCKHIADDRAYFGDSLEAFLANEHYQRSCSFSLVQIGELSAHLTEAFRAAHTGVPWRAMKDLRNLVVHEYGRVQFESLWLTMTTKVPELLAACERILKELG